jgi:uncharacterized DUF497 family protein
MDFEWDETKSEVNRSKHGVSFDAALRVFQDGDRIGWTDEERRNVIGRVGGIVLYVSYTMRFGVCRLISARRANRKERQRYGDRS